MLKTFRQLAELLSPFRKPFYLYLLMIFFYEGAQVLNSYVLTAGIRLYQHKIGLSVWILCFAAVIVFDQAFRFLDHCADWHIVSRLIYPINKHIKMMVAKIFLKQDSAWHQQNNSGVLIGKAQNGAGKVELMTEMLAWEFIPTSIQALLTLPPLMYYSPLNGCLTLISLGLFVLITKKAEAFRLPLRKKRHDYYEELWQSTEEAVKAHETLTIYGQISRVLKEYEQTNNNIIAIGLEEAKRTIFHYHGLRISVNQFTDRIILAILIVQLYLGSITVAETFFVYTLSSRLLTAFWRFARMMQNVGECSEGINRLYDLSKQKPAIVDGPQTIHDMEVPEKLSLEFRNVSFCYPGNPREVIRDMSLIIHEGQEVGVVGQSGSGKTTLRRLLLRLFEIKQGQILLGGIPIQNWPLEKLRSLFAYVPQGDEVFIFDSNIEDNIKFARPEATIEEVKLAAKQAGLQSFIDSLPEKYQTKVGEKGMKLSGGQKQRVALARAILSGRRFLILDEATSSVDALTEQEIQAELREVFSGLTSIVIAHRLSTVRDADKIFVISGGQMMSEGTHSQLMADPEGIYYKMMDVQLGHHGA
jgi:ABC-type multidrug transport system fused ATPase/permease subunit